MPLYPAFEPSATHMLDVGDGHTLYVEQSGNPQGIPVVCLHGGPGTGASGDYRRRFNPAHYHVIGFDQRGAKRSTQAEGKVLYQNTTPNLVADMEKIRELVGVEAWMLYGSSWGSTLALAYATTHPERVRAMMLGGIYFGSALETEWMFGSCGMALFRPEEYGELLALLPGLPPVTAGREVVTAALAAVNGPEPLATQVAKAFMMYEGSAMPVFADPSSLRAYMDAAEDVLHHAQIELHYMANGCFLAEGQLLEGCAKLTHIPTVIHQGVADHVCPPGFAMRLKKALPEATLQWVLSGHWGNDAMEEARVAATDMLVPRLSPNV